MWYFGVELSQYDDFYQQFGNWWPSALAPECPSAEYTHAFPGV